jgi:pSer/pThr/pTyr-binding forkhead associated (FHA) protein
MAKLILSLDGTVMKEVPLDKERLTIGRRSSNDLQIDNLAVSGEHALIVTILNDSFLEDLGSTNGTLVNGVPIKKHILQHNDVVEIGKYKLKYVAEHMATGIQPGVAAEFEKTMVIRPGMAARAAQTGAGPAFGASTAASATSTQPAPMGQAPGLTTGQQPRPAAPPPSPPPAAVRPTTQPFATATQSYAAPAPTQTNMQPQAPAQAGQLVGAIQILTGPSAGKELELVKNLTTLGKPGVQVAVITRRPQGYFITHVEGANFPIVNGRTLDAQAHPLRDHDVVELAGVKMEFFHKGG